ncbi:glucose-6-phosphate isomerase family protein [Microbacterium sp.]|uniref:glucose-6-phosphate isomerase family protein n=1 Tax=Microbacterium sp. TaxID=51671 RepID=UPI0025F8BD12|nr:glucose-6-phosphate isomerase family protein [Microbacterium sp.]
MRAVALPVEPAALDVQPAEGRMVGDSARYEKYLRDLAGLYRDDAAFTRALASDDGSAVYWVESSTIEQGAGALTIGISVLRPGTIGDEFAMTRGHLHRAVEEAEMYYGLSGQGVMLLESIDGRSRTVPISPGTVVHVPGGWVHRSVNVGTDTLSTLFCYSTDAGQDYDIIERAGGMKQLIVSGPNGWSTRPNPDHKGFHAAPQ